MHICNNITLLTHKEDQTPLHIASRLGKTEIVQLLLQHMAHPDAATINGYTPLHIAAREGHLDVTSVLLEAGASHSLATKVSDSQIWLPVEKIYLEHYHCGHQFTYTLQDLQKVCILENM